MNEHYSGNISLNKKGELTKKNLTDFHPKICNYIRSMEIAKSGYILSTLKNQVPKVTAP